MKILKFDEYIQFINEKFISFPVNGKKYNLFEDEISKEMILSKDVKGLTKYLNSLKSNRYDMPSITFYHGTSVNHDIENNGLLATKASNAKSLSTTYGYVYLSIYPDSAKTFGNLAYPYDDIVVYEVNIPANLILSDKDQIFLFNRESGQNIGDNIASSIIYGNGVRVKGDIPPYMIKQFKTYKKK